MIKLANIYDLKIQVLKYSILVFSNRDEWRIDIKDNNQLILLHRNKTLNLNEYHFQKSFNIDNSLKFKILEYNIKCVFKYIYRHDKYVIRKRGSSPVINILEELKKIRKDNNKQAKKRMIN